MGTSEARCSRRSPKERSQAPLGLEVGNPGPLSLKIRQTVPMATGIGPTSFIKPTMPITQTPAHSPFSIILFLFFHMGGINLTESLLGPLQMHAPSPSAFAQVVPWSWNTLSSPLTFHLSQLTANSGLALNPSLSGPLFCLSASPPVLPLNTMVTLIACRLHLSKEWGA